MQPQKIIFEYNCPQKWASMKNVNGNKFCEQCQTSVHDLTEKSHSEILELMSAHNNHLCGHFCEEQLDETEKTNNFFHPKFILAGIAAWLTVTAPKVSAQNNSVQTEQHDSSTAQEKNYKYSIVGKKEVCLVEDAPVVASKKYRRHSITLFHLFGRRVYLSSRFPFLHARRMRVGRMMY